MDTFGESGCDSRPPNTTGKLQSKRELNASSKYALARPLFGHAPAGTRRNGSGLSSDRQKIWQCGSSKGDFLQRSATSEGLFARSQAAQSFASRGVARRDR